MSEDLITVEEAVVVPVASIVPGDVVTLYDSMTILVKSVRRVGSFLRFTAFAHEPTDCWYVWHQSTVVKQSLSFVLEVETCNWEYVKRYTQLPLPFPLEVS